MIVIIYMLIHHVIASIRLKFSESFPPFYWILHLFIIKISAYPTKSEICLLFLYMIGNTNMTVKLTLSSKHYYFMVMMSVSSELTSPVFRLKGHQYRPQTLQC